jgi:hypothetical protein
MAIADRGLLLNPQWTQMQVNRSSALASADRIDEAIASMMRVLEERPNDRVLRGTMLYALNSTSRAPADIFAEHRKYALGATAPAAAVITDADPDRPLWRFENSFSGLFCGSIHAKHARWVDIGGILHHRRPRKRCHDNAIPRDVQCMG